MTADEMYHKLKERFASIVPDENLYHKAKLSVEINRLKMERNAVILGHNYMEPILYFAVADIKGDSLELSRKAASTDKDIIIFCGVKFMAETAKILNPGKTVLLPAEAGCSLAASITAEDVRALKLRYPGVPVVTYVNTYADVKAESDICYTSGNAVAVVQSLHADKIIFLPDEFLASNVAKETGKHIIFPVLDPSVPSKENGLDYQLIGWNGRCEVHEQFTIEDILDIRTRSPEALILSHLECSPEVATASDYSGSTKGMIEFIEKTSAPSYLILTESAMGDNIAASNPDKNILRKCRIRCPHMDQITLENTLDSLKFNQIEIQVPEEIRARAARAVERMIAIG